MTDSAPTKTTYQRRKALGLCVSCGGCLRPGRALCADCNARNNAYQRRRRQARAALGLCLCGQAKPEDKTRCEPCRQANLRAQRKFQARKRETTP